MPNHSATEKSLRKNAKRHFFNSQVRSKIRTLIKKVRAAIVEKNVESARTSFKQVASALDTAAKRHIIHPNNAARRKSRLQRQISQLENAG